MIRRVLFIAGEASGDLHGAGVVRCLRDLRPQVEIFGLGGDRMQKEGMELILHMSDVAVMGFVEVARHLPTILAAERKLERLLDTHRPDVVVLIDYPGFNLRFARKAKQRNIPVLYYISPQVWAWHRNRVKKMKSLVDTIKVVFPFEVEIYRQEGIDVEFVGHPLVERIGTSMNREEFFARIGFDPSHPLVGLFPGSRRQEIERILPIMVGAAEELCRTTPLQVGLGVAPNLGRELFDRYIEPDSPIHLVEHGTYNLMGHADAAVVTSGTATLETGWFATPMVVVYKTSPITYLIGRMLVDVPYIGLVNFVAGKKIVPELVQNDLNVAQLIQVLQGLLTDRSISGAMKKDLTAIKETLGSPGASRRVAESIIALAEAA